MKRASVFVRQKCRHDSALADSLSGKTMRVLLVWMHLGRHSGNRYEVHSGMLWLSECHMVSAQVRVLWATGCTRRGAGRCLGVDGWCARHQCRVHSRLRARSHVQGESWAAVMPRLSAPPSCRACPPHNLLSCLSKAADALQGSFEVLAQQAPTAVAHILDGMARRLAAAATARSTAQCAFPRSLTQPI